MAITLGVHASAGSDDGTTAVTPARDVTSGSCLVACVSWGTDATPATLSDSAGNTWTRIGSVLGPLAGNYPEAGAIYKCENCVGGANYVLTATRSGEYPSVAYQEFLGDGVAVEAIASGPVDTATPYVSTAVTPAADGAGLFSGFVYNGGTGTNTVASPLAMVEEVFNASIYYPLAIGAAVQATAAAVAASWTTTAAPSGGAVWTVALHEAGSGPTPANGSVAITLAAATVAASATVVSPGANGTLTATLGAATGTSTASATISGTLTRALAGATVVAAANAPISGSLARTLAGATCAATASAASGVAGVVAATLAPATIAGAAEAPASGGVALALAAAGITASAEAPITAGVTLTLAGATLVASNSSGTAPTLGDNAIVWSRNGMGTNPQSAGPMTTVDGSTLVVVLACGPEVATQVPTDNYGNTFVQRGSRVEYDLYPGYGTNVFIATNIAGGSGHVVSVDTTAAPFNEFTMHVAEVRGATAIYGTDFSETFLPADPVSPSVATTAPSLMLAYWWGSDGTGVDTIAAGDGFTTFPEKAAGTTIGGYIQGASAHRSVASAGTYSVEWTASPAQGAILGLLAFEGGAAQPETNAVLAVSLAAAAAAATSESTIGASLVATLAPATLLGNGAGLVQATLAATLESASLLGEGNALVQAALAASLGDATLASDGAQAIITEASLSVTLAAATVAADAESTVQASMEATLVGAVVVADAASTITASLSAALADADVAATGALDARAAAVIALESASVSSQGTSKTVTTGEVSAQLDAAAVTAAGAALIQALLARPLEAAAVAANAESTVAGALAATLESASLQATTTAPAEAVVAAILADAVVAATAARLAAGALDLVLDAVGCVATGVAIDVPPAPPLIPIVVERTTTQLGAALRPDDPVLTAERPPN